MSRRSIAQADVRGERLLVRVDFNVPLDGQTITDDTRIRATVPTVQDLRKRGARLILVSHLGRPKGKVQDSLSLRPVAEHLSELLNHPVQLASGVTGDQVLQEAEALNDGDVLLLENVRFDPREEKNDPSLARELTELAEIYVNDAFGAAHRAHASTEGVAHLLPSYIGPLMERELSVLGSILEQPERPFVAILGGAKVSDKLGVIGSLITKADSLILGGGMANTFLLAQGEEIGTSLAEPDLVEQAQSLLQQAQNSRRRVYLPSDVVIANNPDSAGTVVTCDQVPSDQAIFDIGPNTAGQYAKVIATAKTVFRNGPMGMFERPAFANGTLAVAKAIAECPGTTIVGGGDSIAAIEQAGLADQIDHISTGGGASLELIEGKTLPGIAVIPEA